MSIRGMAPAGHPGRELVPRAVQQRPVSGHGDPLLVQRQAAQPSEFLAAPGAPGAPVEHRRKRGSRAR